MKKPEGLQEFEKDYFEKWLPQLGQNVENNLVE